jgi:uroporphyrinogen-III synthase
MKMGEGITGWVAANKSVVGLSRNAFTDSRFKSFSTLVEDTYEAFLSVPLVNSGQVIGVLNVHHKDPHEHTPEEISLLSFLGEQMGGAIAYSQLAEDHSRLQEETLLIKEQLETRKLTERAKGVLQQRFNFSEREAYQRLRDESRRLRQPLRTIAEAILLVEEVVKDHHPAGNQGPSEENSEK